MSDGIRVTKDGPVFRLTIDRPPANAIDAETSRQMGECFAEFRDDPSLRVAVIQGAGERIFCAGWDLKAAALEGENESTDYGIGGFAGIDLIRSSTKPFIAAVNGVAVGGGVELCLACDLIVASESASFALPETGLGVVADAGGVQLLPRMIPRKIAMEMLYTGRRMQASEARDWGLLNAVVAPSALTESVDLLASQVAAGAPLAVEAIKEIVIATEAISVEDAFETVRAKSLPIYAKMLTSEDHREGPLAFAEKRTPVWQGK